MEENKKNDEPVGYFKVDETFIRELDEILLKNFVIEKYRKIIIEEFIKLIKRGIVKK
jgi:hypothetical protein